MPKFTRRSFLSGLGAAGSGAALAAGGYFLGNRVEDSSESHAAAVPFYGKHQSGIATPAQDRLLFASFDITEPDRADLRSLFSQWTAVAALLTQGERIDNDDDPSAPPTDTGEATGLPPSRLTITFGLGPSLFVKDGVDRFGLASKHPEA